MCRSLFFVSCIGNERGTKVDRNAFIEDLRTTLLWENVCSHIESRNEANVLLQMAGLKDNITAERAFIQEGEDFYITDISESGGKIVIGFEIPFILCVNDKYSIEAATGKLDMPGFFTMLTEIYKEGYFPCSWNGVYPSDQAVVL